MTRPGLSLADRFWLKVDITPGCWLWKASRYSTGYGCLMNKGGSWLAHRISYELNVGPIPEGLELDHLCRVRGCVNPAHLEPVTHRENGLRGVGQGALNARKTDCKRGHPLSGDNLYMQNGTRQCVTCRRARDARRPSGWARTRGKAA